MEHKILDHKAAKMLEIYAEERFKDGRSAQRLRLQLVLWVLRMKVLGSLKRLLDFSVAAVMLLLLSPLMSITALLVKWTSPGPIFFGQTRVGKYGTHFTCYKFRSMYTDAEERKAELMKFNEADGPVFKMKNDPRITSVGRIIRKLSIDELPQLWNVLRGDMSLVGPRPPVPKEAPDQLRHVVGEPEQRHLGRRQEVRRDEAVRCTAVEQQAVVLDQAPSTDTQHPLAILGPPVRRTPAALRVTPHLAPQATAVARQPTVGADDGGDGSGWSAGR